MFTGISQELVVVWTGKETKTYHIWPEWWPDLSLFKFVPINRTKEWMLSNLMTSSTNISKAECNISFQKLKINKNIMNSNMKQGFIHSKEIIE